LTTTQAILFCIAFCWVRNNHFYGWQWGQPAVVSFFVGLIMGDLPRALMVGAALQAMYMGIIAPGANIPTDVSLATFFAVPMALVADLTPEMAVVMAVPMGLFGVMLSYVRRTVNATWVHMADKFAAEADVAGVYRAAYLYPISWNIARNLLEASIIIAATRFGPDVVDAFLNAVPAWVTNGLQVTGGMLPALGFAITIMVIGRRNLIPYFIAGYFIATYSKLGIIAMAIFGVILALLHVQFTAPRKEEEAI
jgi:D-glucosaminate-specific PTS system IIC component